MDRIKIMISREILSSVLKENEEEVSRYQVVSREIPLGDFPLHVLVGIRRAGKSFALYQRIQEYLHSGIGWDEMLYANFEDERLVGMDLSDLNLLLEIHQGRYGKRPRLFLDELQVIPGWEHFARRLADQKYEVYITGSNASMLSAEINATLGGRYLCHTIFPYSFKEYLKANDVVVKNYASLSTSARAKIMSLWSDYLQFGGFPEAATLSVRRQYLDSLYKKIFLGDICGRHNLENSTALRILFRKLAESVCHPISHTRLRDTIASVGGRISTTTVISYLQYAQDAWLILGLENLASKLVEKETNRKYFFADTGLLNLFLLDGKSALLENLIAVELLRRYGMEEQVYFYANGVDVDFVVPEASLAVQACYALDETPDTREREITALRKLHRRFPLKTAIIVTNSQEETISADGLTIQVIPAWKWLLGKE